MTACSFYNTFTLGGYNIMNMIILVCTTHYLLHRFMRVYEFMSVGLRGTKINRHSSVEPPNE